MFGSIPVHPGFRDEEKEIFLTDIFGVGIGEVDCC
jgi:hypothetical protein